MARFLRCAKVAHHTIRQPPRIDEDQRFESKLRHVVVGVQYLGDAVLFSVPVASQRIFISAASMRRPTMSFNSGILGATWAGRRRPGWDRDSRRLRV